MRLDNECNITSHRSSMEEMGEKLLRRVEITLQQCLSDCNLKVDDISSVEIVGGSTRIPAIKHLIEKVFKKVPSTTLNQDEAVARGCALQCAMLSPAFKVLYPNLILLFIMLWLMSVWILRGKLFIIWWLMFVWILRIKHSLSYYL